MRCGAVQVTEQSHSSSASASASTSERRDDVLWGAVIKPCREGAALWLLIVPGQAESD